MSSKAIMVVLLTILGSTALVVMGFLQIVQPGPEGTTPGGILIGAGLLLDVAGAICAGWLLGHEQNHDETGAYSPPAAVER